MDSAFKTALAIVVGVAALLPAVTTAQVNGKNEGYLVDQNFNIVTSGTGLCWRTSAWTPARAAAAEGGKRCDPDLVPKPAPAPAAAAPVPAKPAPAPKPEVKKEPPKLLPQKINF